MRTIAHALAVSLLATMGPSTVGSSNVAAQTFAPPRPGVTRTSATASPFDTPRRDPRLPPDSDRLQEHMAASSPQWTAYLRPSIDIQISAADMGLIDEVLVSRGQTVTAGQPLAKLNCDVLRETLRAAEASESFTAAIDAADIEREQQRQHKDACRGLLQDGDLSEIEYRRACQSLQLAEAKSSQRREEAQLRTIQRQRVQAQLQGRIIHAPHDGTIIELIKHAGEFVSPTDSVVMRLINTRTLHATFDVPADTAATLSVDQTVPLTIDQTFGDNSDPNATHQPVVDGRIESIIRLIEPASGTVPVRVTIDNPAGEHWAGQRCRLSMTTTRSVANRPLPPSADHR